MKRHFINSCIALILLGLLGFSACSKGGGTKVTVENASKRSIKETVPASGKIFPEVEVTLSPNVAGEIVELLVAEGDSVTQGQVLAKIDPEAYQSAVERVAASVDNTKAQLANAKANESGVLAQIKQAEAQKLQIIAQLDNQKNIHNRNKKLLEEGIISQADFETSEATLRGLESNLASANASIEASKASLESAKQTVRAAEFSVKSVQASLKETKTSLNRTAVYAPMSGIITSLSVKEGETVAGTNMMAGTELMRIAKLSSIEVRVDVSESDVLRLSVGDKADIEVDAYLDRKFSGIVTEIANSASNVSGVASLNSDQVTNFTVKIRMDRDSYKDLVNPKKRFPFRPGMSASVDITTKVSDNTLSVPIQAVTVREAKTSKDNDLNEVVFLVKNDTIAQQIIKTGIQDDKYIQILEGIEEGDAVVIGPYAAVSRELKSGKKVSAEEKKKD